MIMSVVNCSGKMSVYERTDIEPEGASKVTGAEQGAGGMA